MMGKFVILCNRSIGEVQKAGNVRELLSELNYRLRKNWTCITYKDIANNTICISRANLVKGLSIEESIDDWLSWALPSMLEEPIFAKENGDFVILK